MSDEQGKSHEQDTEKTAFREVWEPGDRVDKGIKRWGKLTWNERARVVVIVIFITCCLWILGAAGLWIADRQIYRSPWLFVGAIAGAFCALAWLLRAQRHRRLETFKLWRGLTLRVQLSIFLAAVLIGTGTVLLWRHQKLSQSRFHNELRNSGLPADLYDYQGQLEALTIDQRSSSKPGVLTDLDWLDSTTLTHLTAAIPHLSSLNGLAHATELQSLDLDLRSTPLKSLAGISSLHHLRTLVLRNLGHAKSQLLLDLDVFPELIKANLDFERSSTSALPELTACRELNDLTLNLRATRAIAEPPDLSGLHQLHSLALFIDNSNLHSLKPLAKLGQLQTLTLTLDGTQLELLQGWLSELQNGPGPQSLTLFFATPPNGNLPNLSGIRRLIDLSFTAPASEPPARAQVFDVTHLGQLQSLAISLRGSEVQALPDIGRLTGLLKLDLDLESSIVQRFPDISQLHDLEQLTLNVGSTGIRELPNFAAISRPYSRLHELNLLLANSRIRSLHGVQDLNGLRRLTLDIRGTRLDDIGSIAQIGSLETLILWLRWSQVGDLPDLALLKNLRRLELHLEQWWSSEELPELGGLQSLEELVLDLKDSRITNLPDFSRLPRLKKVTLLLENSALKDLSPLEQLSGLEELQLDLQRSGVETLPDLTALKKLRRVVADIRHSGVKLSQTQKLSRLQELALDKNLFSLEGLPKSVKTLVIGP